jgi:hypothetical protein
MRMGNRRYSVCRNSLQFTANTYNRLRYTILGLSRFARWRILLQSTKKGVFWQLLDSVQRGMRNTLNYRDLALMEIRRNVRDNLLGEASAIGGVDV